MSNMVEAYRIMRKYPSLKDTFDSELDLEEWLLTPNPLCGGLGPLYAADDGRLDLFESAIKDRFRPKYKTIG